jgi:adenylate kinase family enzyme
VQRVAILGSGGAGKSVLAAAIAERTGLPVVHLDVVYWEPGWKEPPPDEFAAALDAAVAEERWILDGNFLRHGGPDPRFARADTVIFLDLPRTACLWRVVKRRVREARRPGAISPKDAAKRSTSRSCVGSGRSPARNRPRVLAFLDGLQGVDVHRLRSAADVRRYVENL